jgi:hypothetical protein
LLQIVFELEEFCGGELMEDLGFDEDLEFGEDGR